MYPTQSECPSNTGHDQAKEGRGPKEAFSAPVVYINGLPWQMLIKHSDAYVGIFLYCDVDKTDMAWSCRAASQFSVVSCKQTGECLMKRGELDRFHIFTANRCYGYEQFVKIEELMDPKNGLYDEKEDAVTFKAEIVAEEPNGMSGVRSEDVFNGELVNVNKYLLAGYSNFFKICFLDKTPKKCQKFKLTTFRMPSIILNGLSPQCTYMLNKELDDECVEGILLLANRFLLDSVVNRCVHFLLTKSKNHHK